MEARQLKPEEIASFNKGLEMGQAVGAVAGSITGLVLCAAVPLLPWAVGTVVIAQKGWEYGGKAGMSVMDYKCTKDFELKEVQS